MAESKTLEGITWLTSRPGVLALLKRVTVRGDGYACTFEAICEQEFISAGVASLDLFQSLGKSKTKSGSDEYGDWFKLDRRGGAWCLVRLLG